MTDAASGGDADGVGPILPIPADALEAFTARLGHAFVDPALLRQALTHRSWCAEHAGYPSNERLEFLGDAVLGLIVTDDLYSLIPDAGEGQLSRMRASVVCAPALAEMARLDWAISTAFDAVDEVAVDPVQLSSVPAEAWADLHLRPQAHLQVLSGVCNVEAFRRAADRELARPRLRRYRRSRHLLVWRQALAVRYRLIEDDERMVLAAAMRDESFALLCDRLAEHHDPSAAMPRMAGILRGWVDDGVLAGWKLQQDSM